MILRLFKLWVGAMRGEGDYRKSLPHMLAQVWGAAKAWPNVEPFVEPHWWRSRMRACMRCSLYRHASHQCGSANYAFADRFGRAWFRQGCGCAMPLKNLLRGSTCWARQTGRDVLPGVGWPSDVV